MLTRLALLATVLSIGTALLAGPASAAAPKYPYPSSEKSAFTKSCKSSAATSAKGKLTKSQISKYCSAALTCLQNKLSYKRFAKYAQRLLSGKSNPDAKVVAGCVQSAVKQVARG